MEKEIKGTTIFDCTLIDMGQHHTRRGNLTVAESGRTIPFKIKRVFYIYDVPGGASRGAHAHRIGQQFIVAASGSFSVTVDDGYGKRTFMLSRPSQGLLIPPGIWADLENFSSGSVCLVLASDKYEETEYIRLYSDFINLKHHAAIP